MTARVDMAASVRDAAINLRPYVALVPTDEILIGAKHRNRQVDRFHIDMLQRSINDLLLICPIGVRVVHGKLPHKYEVIYGTARFLAWQGLWQTAVNDLDSDRHETAVIECGRWRMIPCCVFSHETTQEQAEQLERASNFVRPKKGSGAAKKRRSAPKKLTPYAVRILRYVSERPDVNRATILKEVPVDQGHHDAIRRHPGHWLIPDLCSEKLGKVLENVGRRNNQKYRLTQAGIKYLDDDRIPSAA